MLLSCSLDWTLILSLKDEDGLIFDLFGCSDSHISSLRTFGPHIFNCLAHDEIELKGIHFGDNIYPNVNLEGDIEVIFSFSPDHLSL